MGLDVTGIGAVADVAGKLIDQFFPNKTEEERAQMSLILTTLQGQFDANKQEAGSQSLFVAGWRPWVGWVCGTGFAVQFVIGPIGEWLSAVVGHPVKFPNLDLGTMMPLLLGMLGLGGLRTYEKTQGVGNGH
jgi:hypothetical protein